MKNSFNIEDEDSIKEILTKKEYSVFKYLAAGKRNKEIAQSLVVTEHTVKAHVSAVLKKLKVKSRMQLLVLLKELAEKKALKK